jgi:hypothetical protein
MPDKSVPILMVGAGNAPFSPDMYFQGFWLLIYSFI